MALLRNGASINGIPGRLLGGFSHVDIAQVGTMHKRAIFTGGVSQRSALPYGHNAPSAWQLPMKPGALSSVNNASVTVTATGTGVTAKNTTGTADITITLTGTGGLISSATGTATVTVDATGGLFASKAAQGTAAVTLTANGGITAIGHTGGSAPATITATWTPYALGWLEGTTAEAGLSNVGIANSVWAKVIEAGFSAEQILRLLAAHAAGSATGLEGSNPQFTGLDGTTVRIDGSYAAGTRTIDSLNGD